MMSKGVKIILAATLGVGAIFWILALTLPQPKLIPRPSTAAAIPSPTSSPTPTPTADIITTGKLALNGAAPTSELARIVTDLKSIPPTDPNYKEAQALVKRVEPLLKKAQAAEAKAAADASILGPEPKNSPWDGSVRCVDRYLKRTLNDYDDAEYLEWSPVVRVDEKDGPYWVVRLKLRARNAFGGKIIKDVIFYIRNDEVVRHSNL